MTVVRLVLFLALTLFACGSAQAQEFVWRVTDADNSVYLAGSIHLLPDNAYPLPAAFRRAFEAADIAAFETDLGELQQLQPQTSLYEAVPYSDGSTLADHIDARLYTEVNRRLEAAGLSATKFDRYHPWYIAGAIEQQAFEKAGFKPELGVDKHFYDQAKKAGKKILPLASVSEHLALLIKMPESLAEAYLQATIDNVEKSGDAPTLVYGFWRRGDVKGMAGYLHRQSEKSPAFYERMVFARNKAWLPKIEQLIDGQTDAMVVVGALHLVGEQGLIHLLRENGYQVERL